MSSAWAVSTRMCRVAPSVRPPAGELRRSYCYGTDNGTQCANPSEPTARGDIRFPPYILHRPSRSTHHGARMPPTLILLVGMATILAGIVLLRLNAFLALIIAAIVVSLLAPGEPAVKIARVAEGFGRTAGTVGIVIARSEEHTSEL